MKILYVATIGGFMPFFKTLVKELIEDGNTVDFAANQTTSKVPTYFKEWGCNVYDISCSRSPFSFGNIKAIKEIRELAKNYDIVHCHTPLAGMATRLACKKLRKKQGLKVIYTAHGFHFYKGAPKKNWILYYPIEKLCSRWTDVLITINKEDYELAKTKLKTKKIEYLPGVGLNIKQFTDCKIDKEQKRKELNLPNEAFVVLSVGELNENKNHKVVIEALAQLNNSSIHYVIAGVGEKKDSLILLAKEVGVNLHVLGFREDVCEIYKASDVFVFPSFREGLGLAAIEALASGLPLICSDNRGTREYQFDGVIVCDPHNSSEFATAIQRVLTDKANIMSAYNQDNLSIFDSHTINKHIKSLYSEVIL